MGTINFRNYNTNLGIDTEYTITHADIYGDMPTKSKIKIVNGFAYLGIFDGTAGTGVSANGNICIFKIDLSDGTYTKLFDGFTYWAGISGSIPQYVAAPNGPIDNDGGSNYIKWANLGGGWSGIIPVDFFVASNGDIYTIHYSNDNYAPPTPVNYYNLHCVKCTAASGYTTFNVYTVGISPPLDLFSTAYPSRVINPRIFPILDDPDSICIISEGMLYTSGVTLWKFNGSAISQLATDIAYTGTWPTYGAGAYTSILMETATSGWFISGDGGGLSDGGKLKFWSYSSGVATLLKTIDPATGPGTSNPYNRNILGFSGDKIWQLMGWGYAGGYSGSDGDFSYGFMLGGSPCWPIWEIDIHNEWAYANVVKWNGSDFELMIDRTTGRYNGGSIAGVLPNLSSSGNLNWRVSVLPNGDLVYTKLDPSFSWYGW